MTTEFPFPSNIQKFTEEVSCRPTLGAGEREVLLLGVVEGMTHSEIATATGKPLGTVKTQLRRGLIKVRQLLESGNEGSGEHG